MIEPSPVEQAPRNEVLAPVRGLPAIKSIPCFCGRTAFPYLDHGRRLFARGVGITAQLFECPTCGHKKFAPEPGPTELNIVYSTSYFGVGERELYTERYQAPNFSMTDSLAESLKRFVKPDARVHEFGCGTGLSVHHLRRLGFDATGSDWSAEAIAFGQSMGNEHILHEGPDKPAPLGDLDAALSNHVIEHLTDPVGFMRAMTRKLKRNGVLVLRCPNGDGAIARRMGMTFDPLYYYPHHLHYFSAQSLVACARAAGLKVIAITATSRFTPELRDHVFPPVFGKDSITSEAMATFQSEELELVVALSNHRARQVKAPKRLPTRALPAVQSFDSHEDFYAGGPWAYDLLHDTFEGCCPMVWSEEHAYWYFAQCFISDQWLAHYGGEYRPGLSFLAPEAGEYEFEIVVALRHAAMPPVWVALDARRDRTMHWVDTPAPRTFIKRTKLEQGERYTVACENPHENVQKLIALVRARKL